VRDVKPQVFNLGFHPGEREISWRCLNQSRADFTPVGIIEVQGPISTPANSLVAMAVTRGSEAGCDALVSQAAYEDRTVRATGLSIESRRNAANGIATWLFTCGVSGATRHPIQQNEKIAAATVRKIVRSEYGEKIPNNPCGFPGD
jgi:hypothetical protein